MNPYLSIVERRADQTPIRVMFVGPELTGVTNIFRRDDEPIVVAHSNSVKELVEVLETRTYDCVMVDQRREELTGGLDITTLAASKKIPHLIIMAAAETADTYKSIHGVHEVLEAPIAPQQIIESIVSVAEKLVEPAADEPAEDKASNQTSAENHAVTNTAFITSLKKFQEIDGSIWQKFVPLASFVYKKLAIVILGALFLTFLFYGVMIVFFMGSSGWSLPFELSRGHELVLRAERDLGQMKVRQNQVRQALTQAEANLGNAERKRRDAELVLAISAKTVDLEIAQQTTMAREARAHIRRLKVVIADFKRGNKRGAFAKNLTNAYQKRTITKKSLNSGTLAVLETLHRMAMISNELAMKEIENDRINNRLLFLTSLKAEMSQPEIRTIVSSGSDFVHLAREIIDAKATISEANKAAETAHAEVGHLSDSLKVVSNNITSLVNTPVGRAINEPVTVLFVPYGNTENYREGSALYGCYSTIVACGNVGTVGTAIEGETTAVHPLFGKPLRGIFIEANIETPEDIKEELLHVGRPPLFL